MEADLQIIQSKIMEIRGNRVLLDFHLAELYGVETRALKQAVRRNMERFPEDFMSQLTELEIKEMVSQNVIPSKKVLGGAKPYAFTEQGVAMLSSVLRSPTAVNVNIAVMRAFVLMRRMIAGYGELQKRMEELEKEMDEQFGEVDAQFKEIYEALTALLAKPSGEERRRIGFMP